MSTELEVLENRILDFERSHNLLELRLRLLDVKTAQAILGHGDIGTTADIYMHASMEQNKNAVWELNELDFSS